MPRRVRVFLDANVLVSMLNKAYPLFTFSSRILSLTDARNHQLYTSSDFYFSEIPVVGCEDFMLNYH